MSNNTGENRLNERQIKFCENYIRTGLVEPSMIEAGYSESYARSQGYLLLEKPAIWKYIQERTREARKKAGYEIEDVIKRLHDRAMGKPEERVFKEVDHLEGDEVTVYTTRIVTPSEKEQNVAADMLMKMDGRYLERSEIELKNNIMFVDDIGIDESEED